MTKPLPKLLSLELFNPETDDVDSDSSGVSSPDSISSVISVLTEELSVCSQGLFPVYYKFFYSLGDFVCQSGKTFSVLTIFFSTFGIFSKFPTIFLTFGPFTIFLPVFSTVGPISNFPTIFFSTFDPFSIFPNNLPHEIFV